jgi:hypothetical protein
MRAIIGLNSAVAMAPDELHWWTRIYPWHRRATSGRAWRDFLERFVDWPPTQGLGLDRAALLDRLGGIPDGDHAGVFGATMRMFATRSGKGRWGEKTPQLELYADEVREAFPAASFVYMVRDPRDVAISMYHYRPGRPRRRPARDVAWVSLNWRESVQRAALEAARDPDRYLIVRYENLVERPRRTVEGLCQILGLEFEDRMLEPDEFPGFVRSRTAGPFGSQEGINRTALGRHHGRLAPRKRWISEWLLDAHMRRFGYDPEPGRLGVLEAALLPIELAGAAGDATLRRLDRIARGVPR